MHCVNTSFIYDIHRQGAFPLVSLCIGWNLGTITCGLSFFPSFYMILELIAYPLSYRRLHLLIDGILESLFL